MPSPKNVNPEKFTVEAVLFDHNDFSVSVGLWTPTGNRVVGMRWNDGDDGSGYPKAFGHPQWFVLCDEIAKNVLAGLLGNQLLSPVEYQAILDALGKL